MEIFNRSDGAGLKCGFPERFAQQALGHNSKRCIGRMQNTRRRFNFLCGEHTIGMEAGLTWNLSSQVCSSDRRYVCRDSYGVLSASSSAEEEAAAAEQKHHNHDY